MNRHLSHVNGAPWTMAELRDLVEDRRRRPLHTIASDIGVHRSALGGALRRAGLDGGKLEPSPEKVQAARERDKLLMRAHALHQAGRTWAEVAAELGWPRQVWSLKLAVQRWRNAAGIELDPHKRVAEARRQGAADAALVSQALRNLQSPGGPRPRWAVVTEAFGVGSTAARALCRRFDLDPDEELGAMLALGDECPLCGMEVPGA